MMDAGEWDERYGASDLVWSAGPNGFVEATCEELSPGRMLDLAAGEGRNALWFAEKAWEATAVDFSATALRKAQEIAERRGVALETIVADLLAYEPEIDRYDLVLIAYLHVAPSERALVLGRGAAAVTPGGYLLLVGHDVTNIEHGYGGPSDPSVLTSPDEVVAGLGDRFVVSRAEVVDRAVDTDEGPRVAKDTLVFARKSAA